MQKKLNEDFIDNYCEKFAAKITESFFGEERLTITGKEIMEVTPSKQTNFFILKLIFGYWQGEVKKLESPYFNYEHEEAQSALTEFMNVISQHIEVHKNNFQMLLNHALKDSLYLIAVPQAYIEIDLEDRRVDKIDEEVIEETLKYIKVHKKEIGNFFSDMRGLTIDDVIDELPEEFEGFNTMPALIEETKILSEIHPIGAEQVLVDDYPDDFEDDEVFDNDDEEDDLGDVKTENVPEEEAKKDEVAPQPPKEDIPAPQSEQEPNIPINMNWEGFSIDSFDDDSSKLPLDTLKEEEKPAPEPEAFAPSPKKESTLSNVSDESDFFGDSDEVEEDAGEDTTPELEEDAIPEPVEESPKEEEAEPTEKDIERPKDEEQSSSSSFFDEQIAEDTDENVAAEEPESPSDETETIEPVEEKTEVIKEEEPESEAPTKEKEAEVLTEEEKEAPKSKQEVEPELEVQSEPEPEVKTINDQFEAPESTVADHIENKGVSSLLELISVNHQFMFVKELFNDDQVSFQNALFDLEEYESFDDAVQFLVQGYAKEFKWDMQSTEVKELLKVLFRKYRG